jgi:hypothetical protein
VFIGFYGNKKARNRNSGILSKIPIFCQPFALYRLFFGKTDKPAELSLAARDQGLGMEDRERLGNGAASH